MFLRTSLLRYGRLLQTYHTPAIRTLLIRDIPLRRSFHASPSFRNPSPSPESTPPDSTSEAPSSSSKQSEPVEQQQQPTEAEAKPADEAKAPQEKDIPPPPPKREDKYLRSVAEFRNLQSQTRRDVAAAQAFTIQRFSVDLLDTIDTLTNALESCPPLPPLETLDPNQKEDLLVTEHRNLHEGLGMVEHILLKTLERNGLTVIPTDGEAIPNFHEVVKEVEGEEKDVDTIASVIKRGYVLNGKVLRPAQVVVFKAKTPSERSSTEEKSE